LENRRFRSFAGCFPDYGARSDFTFDAQTRASAMRPFVWPKRDARVVVKLDLPSADAANDPPAMLPRQVAQFLSRERAHDPQLRRMGHEILGFHREHPRNLRNHRRKLLLHT
jgi:hypothetical protein